MLMIAVEILQEWKTFFKECNVLIIKLIEVVK
jgi:hypothetical protein